MTTIRQLREEQGWSQFDLALKVGVRPETVYQWETGRAMPKVLQLRKLAEIFGLSSDAITLVRRQPDRRRRYAPGYLFDPPEAARLQAFGGRACGRRPPAFLDRQRIRDLDQATNDPLRASLRSSRSRQ